MTQNYTESLLSVATQRESRHGIPPFVFQRDYSADVALVDCNRDSEPRLNIRLMASGPGFSATFAFECEPETNVGRVYEPRASPLCRPSSTSRLGPSEILTSRVLAALIHQPGPVRGIPVIKT